MVSLVALHWMTTPEQMERGFGAFRANSERAKTAKGFVSRVILKSTSDPAKYTTVTTWETMEDYESFQKAGAAARPAQRDPNAPSMFEKLERDVYEVVTDL